MGHVKHYVLYGRNYARVLSKAHMRRYYFGNKTGIMLIELNAKQTHICC